MRATAVLALLIVAGLLAFASPGSSGSRCRTTGPNHNTLERGMLGGLFGNGRMAASAYRVIKVDSRTRNADGSIGEKFWWYGAPDVKGDLRISGYRLDRPGGKVTGSPSPGSDTAHPRLRFWAVGVRFPAAGCWRVIGTAGKDRLSLVVLVRR